MQTLITGATGYIGSHLAHYLVVRGWTVHAVVRGTGNRTRLPAGTIAHVHDGSTAGMVNIVAAAEPDVVFHLAGLPRARYALDDLDAMIAANLSFGVQLLEGMAQSGRSNLIESGTYWEFDGVGRYFPNSLYAASKHAFRTLTVYYARRYRLRTITLILYDVYGPNDWRDKFLSQLVRALATNTPLAASPGEQLLDCVHVDDVVRAFAIAAERLTGFPQMTASETFHLDSGRRLKLRELAELIAGLANRPLQMRWGELPYPPLQIMEPLDNGPRLPGWEPQVPLEKGLASLFYDACGAAGGAAL